MLQDRSRPPRFPGPPAVRRGPCRFAGPVAALAARPPARARRMRRPHGRIHREVGQEPATAGPPAGNESRAPAGLCLSGGDPKIGQAARSLDPPGPGAGGPPGQRPAITRPADTRPAGRQRIESTRRPAPVGRRPRNRAGGPRVGRVAGSLGSRGGKK